MISAATSGCDVLRAFYKEDRPPPARLLALQERYFQSPRGRVKSFLTLALLVEWKLSGFPQKWAIFGEDYWIELLEPTLKLGGGMGLGEEGLKDQQSVCMSPGAFENWLMHYGVNCEDILGDSVDKWQNWGVGVSLDLRDEVDDNFWVGAIAARACWKRWKKCV